MKPPQINDQGGLPLSTIDLLAVAEFLASRDTGVSSQYMASVAIAGKVTKSEWLDATPSDASDLGRCVRLIEKAPTVRNCFPILRTASPAWASYIDHWDELTTLFRQGNHAVTTGRMRDIRSSANVRGDSQSPDQKS